MLPKSSRFDEPVAEAGIRGHSVAVPSDLPVDAGPHGERIARATRLEVVASHFLHATGSTLASPGSRLRAGATPHTESRYSQPPWTRCAPVRRQAAVCACASPPKVALDRVCVPGRSHHVGPRDRAFAPPCAPTGTLIVTSMAELDRGLDLAPLGVRSWFSNPFFGVRRACGLCPPVAC